MQETVSSATILGDIGLLVPEIVLALGIMALMMVGAFRGDKSTGVISTLAVALLIGAGLVVVQFPADTLYAFAGSFVVDPFATFMKVLALGASAIAILMSSKFIERERMARFEYPILILFATLGMMMMISANDLIALYVGIELQSLALYVLAAFNRDSMRASEAGLKYFVLGALSSGLLLYGASLVYGFAGSTDYIAIAEVLKSGEAPVGVLVGLVFLLAGLAFKVSAVPFHMWTPDVYEGAPTPVTAFLAAAPKVAAFAVFIRVLYGLFPELTVQWQPIIGVLAVLSMAIGAFGAIGQTNIKRLMAYSTIGHMGYALVGLAAGTQAGVQSVLLYMAIYVVSNLGIFVCILAMRYKEGMVESIESLSGLARRQPYLAAAIFFFMFSLAGIPPFAGFFAKLFVFLAAVEAGLWSLAVIGVFASVISAFYYLRIVKIMYVDEPGEPFEEAMGGRLRLILTGSAGFVLLFGLALLPIYGAADFAAAALFQ